LPNAWRIFATVGDNGVGDNGVGDNSVVDKGVGDTRVVGNSIGETSDCETSAVPTTLKMSPKGAARNDRQRPTMIDKTVWRCGTAPTKRKKYRVLPNRATQTTTQCKGSIEPS
jgi:hypothetical protein